MRPAPERGPTEPSPDRSGARGGEAFCGSLTERTGNRDAAAKRGEGRNRIVGVGSDVGPHFVCANGGHPPPFRTPRRRRSLFPKKFHRVIGVTSRSNKAAYAGVATRSSSPIGTDPPLPGRGLWVAAGNLFHPSRIVRVSAAARSPVDGLADRKGEIIGMIDFVPCACPR